MEAAELAVDSEEFATGSIGELGGRWSRGRRRGANPRETRLLENHGESVGASTRANHGGRVAQQLRIQRYLRALFARDERGALIEVRYRYRDGMRRTFFDVTDTSAAARSIVRLATATDVYVGVAPRLRLAGGKDAIERVWSLWADLDHPDAGAALDDLPVAPAIVIASGTPGHVHAYWPLATAVSVAVAEEGNRRLAAELRGDAGAVTNAATILRPPSTYSHKTRPPTLVALHRFDPPRRPCKRCRPGSRTTRLQRW